MKLKLLSRRIAVSRMFFGILAIFLVLNILLTRFDGAVVVQIVPEKHQQHSNSHPVVVYPRVCTYSNLSREITWVMFMGDSNIRHTYYWWVTKGVGRFDKSTVTEVPGHTFGLDRRELKYGGRWADQEVFTVPKDDENQIKNETETEPIKRYSLRFLHGTLAEFTNAAKNWDIARVGARSPSLDKVIAFNNNANNEKATNNGGTTANNNNDNSSVVVTILQEDDERYASSNWTGKVRPSEYALWATKHQKPIQNNSDQFDHLKKGWKKASPDVVILTHGWRGVPESGDIETVRGVFDRNPETLLFGHPTKERYRAFVESGIFREKRLNLRMVNLWDLVAKNLPKPDKKGKKLYHAVVGGNHMKESMARIWNAATRCE